MKSNHIYKKLWRFSVFTASTSLLVISGAAVAFYNFTLNKCSRIHMGRFSQKKRQKDAAGNAVEYSGAGGTEEEQVWFAKAGKDIYITSDDGLRLHARLFRNRSAENKFAITCHGYTSRSEYMAGFARHFYDLGFHVLVPDARSHGTSEGNIMGMGWLDRKDILKWIRYITEKAPASRIVLHGVSMGGAAVMMAAGENLPPNVRAIIEDCGYSSVYDEFKYQIRNMFKLPAFPFVNATSLVSRAKAGYTFKEASCVAQVSKSHTPILFIHGEKDTFVPYEMLDRLYQAAACEKERLSVKDADHALSNVTDPELYWNTIQSFTEKYL